MTSYKQRVLALVPEAYCVRNRHFEGTVPLMFSVRGVLDHDIFESTAARAWQWAYPHAQDIHWKRALDL